MTYICDCWKIFHRKYCLCTRHNILVEVLVLCRLHLGGLAGVFIIYKLIISFFRVKRSLGVRNLYAFISVPLIPNVLLSGKTCQRHHQWQPLWGRCLEYLRNDCEKGVNLELIYKYRNYFVVPRTGGV